MDVAATNDQDLFGRPTHPNIREKDVTHSGGRGEAFHDWFPYLEGFSSQFVKDVLASKFSNPSCILEPFGGVGTTPVALAQLGIASSYCEVNPFLCELVDLKSLCLSMSELKRKGAAAKIEKLIHTIEGELKAVSMSDAFDSAYSSVFGSVAYFPEGNFRQALQFKSIELQLEDALSRSFLRMAVATCLLNASLLRRAGDVRFKTEKELLSPIPSLSDLVTTKLGLFASDIESLNGNQFSRIDRICTNAKELYGKSPESFDGVITSPPYLNGTNYIRNTKLELWYLGYLNSKSDLRNLRTEVVTSAINDVAANTGIHVVPEAKYIVDKVAANCYDKRIPKMVSGYFEHMMLVAKGICNAVRPGSPVCIDIGDSLYGGVHVPTHDVLKDVFENQGLGFEDEIVLRKRFSNKGHRLSQRLLIFRKLK